MRETFFLNQVHNAGHTIHLHEKADFLVDERFIFEVGRRNKNTEQIRGLDNSWLVMDDIETGFKKWIPLRLFGAAVLISGYIQFSATNDTNLHE